MNMNTVYQAGVAMESALGDTLMAVEIVPSAGDDLVVMASTSGIDKVVFSVVRAAFESRGFTITRHALLHDEQAVVVEVSPSAEVPNIAAVVGT